MTQRESRPAGNRAAPKSTGDADTHSLTTGLTRRRAAARRMPPLAPCGCIRTPTMIATDVEATSATTWLRPPSRQ